MAHVYLGHNYLNIICYLFLYAKPGNLNTGRFLVYKDANKDSKGACTIKVH